MVRVDPVASLVPREYGSSGARGLFGSRWRSGRWALPLACALDPAGIVAWGRRRGLGGLACREAGH
jgi:hypothetical protein